MCAVQQLGQAAAFWPHRMCLMPYGAACSVEVVACRFPCLLFSNVTRVLGFTRVQKAPAEHSQPPRQLLVCQALVCRHPLVASCAHLVHLPCEWVCEVVDGWLADLLLGGLLLLPLQCGYRCCICRMRAG